MTPQLQKDIEYSVNTWDSPGAIRILNMAKKDPSLGIDPKVLLQLRYVRMNSLSVEQLLELMHESILAAYSIPDFDLDFRIKDYLEQLDNVGEEVKFSQGLLKVLDSSEEVLGSKNISIKNNPVKPTIGNWLEDFSSFPSGGREKDALAEIEYLNKSASVKVLSEQERGILKNIIKLYDHAVQNVALWNTIEVPKSQAELYKDYDLYKLIPGLEDDLEEEAQFKRNGGKVQQVAPEIEDIESESNIDQLSVEEPQQLAQSTPQPKPQPQPTPAQRQAVADITRAPHTPVNYNTGAPGANIGGMSASDSAKIRDFINHVPPANMRGVTMDPTNVKIDEEQQRLNTARAKQVADIQRKLAELRSRNNKTQ